MDSNLVTNYESKEGKGRWMIGFSNSICWNYL